MYTLTHYKGFDGVVTYIDTDEDLITGELANIENIITFQARTPVGLQQAFQESVDDYLQLCQERGIEPHKPHSGKVALRLSPETHGAALVASRGRGVSLNAYLSQAVEQRLAEDGFLVHGGGQRLLGLGPKATTVKAGPKATTVKH